MKIRRCTEDDLEKLIEIDEKAYGKYGARDYLSKRVLPPYIGLVTQNEKMVTGFVIFNVIEKGEVPEGFSGKPFVEEMTGRWAFIEGFTTETNYKNIEEDTELLKHAEKIAKKMGCIESGVPLPKDHPFENQAITFWEKNGYKENGEVSWTSEASNIIDCYFYKKQLIAK